MIVFAEGTVKSWLTMPNSFAADANDISTVRVQQNTNRCIRTWKYLVDKASFEFVCVTYFPLVCYIMNQIWRNTNIVFLSTGIQLPHTTETSLKIILNMIMCIEKQFIIVNCLLIQVMHQLIWNSPEILQHWANTSGAIFLETDTITDWWKRTRNLVQRSTCSAWHLSDGIMVCVWLYELA